MLPTFKNADFEISGVGTFLGRVGSLGTALRTPVRLCKMSCSVHTLRSAGSKITCAAAKDEPSVMGTTYVISTGAAAGLAETQIFDLLYNGIGTQTPQEN